MLNLASCTIKLDSNFHNYVYNIPNDCSSDWLIDLSINQSINKYGHINTERSICAFRSSETSSCATLIDWVLNARQLRKVPLSQLRGGKPAQMVKDGQQDTMHNTMLHDNNVTQLPVKHSSYKNATTGYLI